MRFLLMRLLIDATAAANAAATADATAATRKNEDQTVKTPLPKKAKREPTATKTLEARCDCC